MINILFEDSKPQRVTFISGFNGKSYPMRQVNHDELRIRGFKWFDDIRPKSKYDILSN